MTRPRIIGLVVIATLLVVALTTHGFGLAGRRVEDLKVYGNVDVRQVELAFRVPGRLASMAFDEGAQVPRGAILAKLDTRPFDDAVSSAAAQVMQAEADLEKSRNGNRVQDIARAQAAVAEERAVLRRTKEDYDRRAALLPSGAISHAIVTASKADYEVSLARLKAAEDALSLQRAGSRREDVAAAVGRRQAAAAQFQSAETNLADAVLIAPEAGTILTRAREPGAIVQGGETVFTLTIDRPMRLRAYIAQGAISRISPDMPVQVTADGNSKTYHGTIGFISPTAEFTPKSVQTESLRADLVYRLRINVSDPDDALRQGQPVSIAIPAARPAAAP